jgi:hypothetical protein
VGELRGKSAIGELHAQLDDELDDLPRYMAIVNQSEKGWMPGDPIEGPTMVTCVTVDDVRDMLRRKLARAAAALDDLEAADAAGSGEKR